MSAVSAFCLMLALGNFGHPEFGFMDCLPAGVLLAVLFCHTASDLSAIAARHT